MKKITASISTPQNKLTDMLFGINLEHMGRVIYGGIYDKSSAKSDAEGFRTDVAQALRDLHASSVRYPGGNFASGYNWRDGVGKNRPRKLSYAWQQIETNEIGLHEMTHYVNDVIGSKMMMTLNMGLGSIQNALDLVEYCNFWGGTQLTKMRKENGREEPFAFKYWCLGNEMDGRWQMGHLSARDYAEKAKETARLIRLMDKDAHLTACGSSKPLLPQFLVWEKEVLDILYENVDAISMHCYLGVPDYFKYKTDTVHDYVGTYKSVEHNIQALEAIIKETKLRKNSKHDVAIAFDEWNIWHRKPEYTSTEKWQETLRLFECIYDFKDAILLANMLALFVRYSHVIKIASYCQSVNTLGFILTQGEEMVKQTTYYPYHFCSNYLKGYYVPVEYEAGTIHSESFGEYEAINVVSTVDGANRAILAINNAETEGATITIDLTASSKLMECKVMCYAHDEANTFETPDAVVPKQHKATVDGAKLTFELPAFSIVTIRLKDDVASVQVSDTPVVNEKVEIELC